MLSGSGCKHLCSRRIDHGSCRWGYASVPVDGWTQMLVYRKDLFDAAGLEAPNSYANVLAAIEKLHNPPKCLVCGRYES